MHRRDPAYRNGRYVNTVLIGWIMFLIIVIAGVTIGPHLG